MYDWPSNPILTSSFPMNPYENLKLFETPKLDGTIVADIPNSVIIMSPPDEDVWNPRLEEEEERVPMENQINKQDQRDSSDSAKFGHPIGPTTESSIETNKINNPTKPEDASSDSAKFGHPIEPTTESSCKGRYVYVQEVPTRFNQDLLDNCHSLNNWTNMCQYMENMGLGPHLRRTIPGGESFYATHQFSLEVIFHNRMKQYKCLTKNSSMASAVFVPYYSGLDVARYLWGSTAALRDAGPIDLYEWLRNRREWKVMSGRDHFMVAGRITWDFRRGIDEDSAWGNKLMLLPESQNLTMLTIESSPWNKNDFAIPYPTYFHPSNDKEVLNWQNRMRRVKRPYLYSFAGGKRPKIEDSIRGEIMNQCQSSGRKCKLMECIDASNKCLKPDYLMKIFFSSVFCLQPPGDSFTRRSIFDSIVAGCIPVFFHPASAYTQYLWHLPKNYKKYSVLISEGDVKAKKVRIELVLGSMKRSEVIAMREEVIKLIPKVVYKDPRSRLRTGRVEDAFDLTMKGVLERVERLRKENGHERLDLEPEELSWKYRFFGHTENNNEWDHYFKRRDKIVY
ncbi:probable xyloglucan galactosyltransferase GT11 [Impatiens glandulifera]|uniref:probable xyloglucan galactosyltransferase GT11 n=1 Tax=Impatiens glandulifera TaxID=253017 RepID=UPI001FB12615|nr:probable xyloglucan galactosyltransferase GT11 [Impatiens glandulifera]